MSETRKIGQSISREDWDVMLQIAKRRGEIIKRLVALCDAEQPDCAELIRLVRCLSGMPYPEGKHNA